MNINEPDRQALIGALDSLGGALAQHHHRWSTGERTIYEVAIEILTGEKQNPPLCEEGEEWKQMPDDEQEHEQEKE